MARRCTRAVRGCDCFGLQLPRAVHISRHGFGLLLFFLGNRGRKRLIFLTDGLRQVPVFDFQQARGMFQHQPIVENLRDSRICEHIPMLIGYRNGQFFPHAGPGTGTCLCQEKQQHSGHQSHVVSPHNSGRPETADGGNYCKLNRNVTR